MLILLIATIGLVLYLPIVLILSRNLGFSQPWKAVFSLSAFPMFVAAMILNMWLADIYTPWLWKLFAEAQEKGQDESIFGFAISVPITVLVIAAWYLLLRALDNVTKTEKQKPSTVDREKSTDFSLSLLWVVVGFSIVITVGLAATGFHYFLGATIERSIYLGFAVYLALSKGWFFLSARKRMRYSPEADAAFQRFVEEVISVLVAKNDSLSQVAGVWSYGYPKVVILFSTDDGLRQAKESGLIDRIASTVTDRVRKDPAFGKNRESFGKNQALFATADKKKETSLLYRTPRGQA